MPETTSGTTDEQVDILLLGMEEDGYIVVNDDGTFDSVPEYHDTWAAELKRRAAALGVTMTMMTN